MQAILILLTIVFILARSEGFYLTRPGPGSRPGLQGINTKQGIASMNDVLLERNIFKSGYLGKQISRPESLGYEENLLLVS